MTKLKDLKLSVKLIGGGLLAVLVPMLIVGIISIMTASNALVQGGKASASQVAKDLSIITQLFLEQELKFAAEVAKSPLLRDTVNTIATDGMENSTDAIKKLDNYLGDLHGKLGDRYELFFMSNSQGAPIADSQGGKFKNTEISVMGRDYFEAGKLGKSIIGVPVKSKSSGMPVVVLSVPVKTRAGKFAGVLGVVLKLDWVSAQMSTIKIGKTGYPFMIDKEGIIISHPKSEYILNLI
ncbi:MAG: hypothetical protein GY710_05405 [Desulfobacteraceae bacterium]|nr:hypothetical protein [Desulfobacteraceae bacterium]